jgi:hypothetical protein
MSTLMTRLKSAQVAKAERQALMARSSSVGPLDERAASDGLPGMFHLRASLRDEPGTEQTGFLERT